MAVKVPYNFIKEIDWTLLREQKVSLISLAEDGNIREDIREHLDGLIALVDGLQDWAVDGWRIPEQDVFGPTSKEEE